jgi:porin
MQLGRALTLGAWGVAICAGRVRADPEAPPPADQPEPGWLGGDHLTGEWGGARSQLADRGVTIDVVYASDIYTAHGDMTALGHVDAALTLDTHKLGLWDGGTFYVLGQNNHGSGPNEEVGSAVGVSNLEAQSYTQLTELFLEQTLFGHLLRIRIGKQDANRDFGTPRFGGNFINNNFGMFPNAPLVSYPATGLGAVVIVQPVDWLVTRAAVYENSPGIGGLGLTTAFDGNGYTLAASAAVTHHFGVDHRDGGTTSLGGWRQTGEFPEVDDDGAGDMPRVFGSDDGWFAQHDERIYLHPDAPSDPRGLTLIVRYSRARPDRSAFGHYAGGSAAWHGVGARDNDTVGVGGGTFSVGQPLGGSPGPRSESFVEGFYKLRFTSFASLQPDVQWFHHPGGDGRDAVAAGFRLKLKL